MLVCVCHAGRHAAPTTPTPLGVANFVTGSYSWGGTTLTASDVVSAPSLINSNGLDIPTGHAAVAILNNFQSALLSANWTIKLEMELLDASNSNNFPIILSVDDGTNNGAIFIMLDYFFEWEAQDGGTSGAASRFVADDVHSLATGIHRIAMTRTDSGIALSVDGNAVLSDAQTATFSPGDLVAAHFGSFSAANTIAVRIRSLSIYSPLINSALPLLSA
jgi:hypothetical protein